MTVNWQNNVQAMKCTYIPSRNILSIFGKHKPKILFKIISSI